MTAPTGEGLTLQCPYLRVEDCADPVVAEKVRRARLAVAARAVSPEDGARLLDMLGLLPERDAEEPR